MRTRLLTVIPVYNGANWILRTMESVARQTVKPDRVIVSDNCSTDNTEEVVKSYKGFPFDYRRNERNMGPQWNGNFSLKQAQDTLYLHALHADDVLYPEYYETMIRAIEPCNGRGLAWCLDERIDEDDNRLSLSGKPTGKIEVFSRDRFVREKAQIGNHACSGTLLKSNYQPSPCWYPPEYPMMSDTIMWPNWGVTCDRIVRVHLPLIRYRWHDTNDTTAQAGNINSLVCQEWETMQMIEKLRGKGITPYRKLKLLGLFAVRTGIKARRFKEHGNSKYSEEITEVGRKTAGPLLWLAARMLIEMREIIVFKMLGRQKHPKNIYG
jgi:glycosyltransferase involved in cell wall biosynthesis